jgi:hypothetical protein
MISLSSRNQNTIYCLSYIRVHDLIYNYFVSFPKIEHSAKYLVETWQILIGFYLKNGFITLCRWLVPVILATGEIEIKRIVDPVQASQKSL